MKWVPPRRGTIVVDGDSIPAGYLLAPGLGFPFPMIARLRKTYELVNLSVPGSFEAHTGFDLRPGPVAKAYVQEMALNAVIRADVFGNPTAAQMYATVTASHAAARGVGIQVRVAMCMLPIDPVRFPDVDQDIRTEYNALLHDDIGDATVLFDPNTIPYIADVSNTLDGVHLSEEGQRLVGRALAELLWPLL